MQDTTALALRDLATDLRPSMVTWVSGQIKLAIDAEGISHDHEVKVELEHARTATAALFADYVDTTEEPRLSLFQRTPREGFTCWGNELREVRGA